MDQDIELKVILEVQEAEKGLDKISQKAQEVKEKVKDLNNKTQEGIPAVKNLGQSFEIALGKADKNMKGLISSINGTIKGIKGFAPAFKAARTAGDSLWRSIKVGIASTGIGLLIVALGEVIGNWEKWTSTIQSWLPWVKKGKEETEALDKASTELVSANQEQNKLIDYQARLLRAQGVEESKIITFKIQETTALKSNTQAQIKETEAKINSIKAHSAFRRWITGENKDLEGLEETLKRLTEENKRLDDSLEGLSWDLKIEDAKSENSSSKKKAKAAKEAVEELKKYTGEAMSVMEAFAKNVDGKVPKVIQDYFVELLKPESPRKPTEEIVRYIQSAYNAINQTIDKEENKLRLSYETYQGLLAGDAQTYSNELEEMISERHLMMSTGRVTLVEDLEKELEIQRKAYADEEVILTKRRDFLKENNIQGTEFEDITSQLTRLADERIAFIREQTRKIAEAVLEEETEVLEKQSELFNWDVGINLADFRENYRQRQEALQQYFASMRDSYDEGSVMYEKYAEEYEKITEKLNNIDKERVMAEFQYLDKQLKYWRELAGGIADIIGSVADIREEDIKRRQKEGEISEEQADEEFKRVKKLQIAQVWINTLSGAIGSFMQASATYPPPAGQILGATLAAAALASGIAQTQKIKNTTLNGGTGGGGGVSAPSVGVTPLSVTDDIQVSPSALAQSQSPAEQRVWISQADLEESHRQVEIRESNTSF